MSSKSTFSNSTSKSYAIALYELSREKSELDKVEDGMKGLNKLLNESSDFREMISSPIVTKEDKKNVIFTIADKNNFSQVLKKFLGFITIKNRLFFFVLMHRNFCYCLTISMVYSKYSLLNEWKPSVFWNKSS